MSVATPPAAPRSATAGVEVRQVADGADRLDLAVGEDADARGVVAAVLELAQALDEELLDRPVADVSDDAAHGSGEGSPEGPVRR